MHVPEPILQRRGFGRDRSRQRVRMDLGERKVPEGEPGAAAQGPLDAFDLPECPPGVRALIIAVLDDQARRGRTADVIDVLI